MRTADAVNPAPGLVTGLVAVLAVYVVMTIGTVYVLRRMVRYHRLAAPQEADARSGGAR
jgi:cytochrome d ubiquinol oxidase subunit I